MIDRHVPCNGCTACCRGTRIALHADRGDRPHEHGENAELDRDGWRLAHKRGSDECVYLDGDACSIFGEQKRPIECRGFDCVAMARLVGWKAGPTMPRAILAAAKRIRAAA